MEHLAIDGLEFPPSGEAQACSANAVDVAKLTVGRLMYQCEGIGCEDADFAVRLLDPVGDVIDGVLGRRRFRWISRKLPH